jgi:hypothetical protein
MRKSAVVNPGLRMGGAGTVAKGLRSILLLIFVDHLELRVYDI